MKMRLKVCCISSIAEAKLAIKYGACAIGLVSEMPSGPGIISEVEIKKIANSVPPGVTTFMLTSRQDAAEIIAQQKRCGVNAIQVCDTLKSGTLEDIRLSLPGISIVPVIHVAGSESIDEAIKISAQADAILLDSGNKSAKIKTLGGTGATHDWSISRKIRDSVSVPVFLAGGLTIGNIKEAVSAVNPFAIDSCSGLRTNGKLDEKKLAEFTKALN